MDSDLSEFSCSPLICYLGFSTRVGQLYLLVLVRFLPLRGISCSSAPFVEVQLEYSHYEKSYMYVLYILVNVWIVWIRCDYLSWDVRGYSTHEQ